MIILPDEQEGEESPRVGKEALKVVDDMLSTFRNRSLRSLSDCLTTSPVTQPPEFRFITFIVMFLLSIVFLGDSFGCCGCSGSIGVESAGMQICEKGRLFAVNWTLNAVNASSGKLNSAKAGPLFGRLIDELQLQARKQLRSFVEEAAAGSKATVHPSALAAAERGLQESLFALLLPFYRRQLQLLRAQVASELNTELTGEPDEAGDFEGGEGDVWAQHDDGLGGSGQGLEVDAFIMQRLEDLSKRALNCFHRRARHLLPGQVKSAPVPPRTGWSAATEYHQLAEALQQLLDEREAHYRRLGILPRDDHIPVALSVHVLQGPELGLARDYRQDPLGSPKVGDQPVLSAAAVATSLEQPTVRPAAARKRLVSLLQAAGAREKLLDGGSKAKLTRQSEFSREMLMFPLSVKNPSVAMAARARTGRQSRPRSVPDPDLLERTGPERYIRWDIEPMDQVRAALDSLTRSGKGPQATTNSRGFQNILDEVDHDMKLFHNLFIVSLSLTSELVFGILSASVEGLVSVTRLRLWPSLLTS